MIFSTVIWIFQKSVLNDSGVLCKPLLVLRLAIKDNLGHDVLPLLSVLLCSRCQLRLCCLRLLLPHRVGWRSVRGSWDGAARSAVGTSHPDLEGDARGHKKKNEGEEEENLEP